MKEAERLAKAVGAFGGPEATALSNQLATTFQCASAKVQMAAALEMDFSARMSMKELDDLAKAIRALLAL